MIRTADTARIAGDMIVLAHATHWLEVALLTLPAGLVAASIARSLRLRRDPVSRPREETSQ